MKKLLKYNFNIWNKMMELPYIKRQFFSLILILPCLIGVYFTNTIVNYGTLICMFIIFSKLLYLSTVGKE